MSRLPWLGVWLLQACASDPTTAASRLDAAADEQDSGRPMRALDAGDDGGRMVDASRRDASDVVTLDDGSMEASQPLERPVPAPPCDDELGFVGGTVRPDLGRAETYDAAGLDLERPGEYAVFEQDLRVPLVAETRSALGYEITITAGDLAGTVYAPSDDMGSSIAKERFPLLIGAPGFQASYADYAGTFRHFASHGFVVVGIQTRGGNTVPTHDKEALETSQVISFMLDQSAYRDHLDADKIVAAGHSKGGKVSFFAAALDPRIDMVFGWDPSNAGGPPCGAIADLTGSDCNLFPVAPNCLAVATDRERAPGVLQFMHAETFVFGVPPDALTNPTPEHNARNFYRGAPSPASLVYLAGGHASWVESGALGLGANADIIRVTKAVQTAKMLTTLRGATGLERYLPGGAYLSEQGALVREVASK
jgi:dienelactone hydrolase